MVFSKKKLLGSVSLALVMSLQLGCSSDKDAPILNTRVEDGLVVLGSDPVIDDAYKVQKEVVFMTRDNIMKPASDDPDSEQNYELDSPYPVTGSTNNNSSSTFGKDYTSGSTYRSQLNEKISKVNVKLLANLPFDNKGTINKTKITRADLNKLMDSYSADIYKNASEKNLQDLYKYAVGALKGQKESQIRLADFYLDGYGNSSYEQLAISWYLLAANNGSTYAKYMISIFYQMGYGVPQDLTESVAWYKKASQASDSVKAKIAVAKRYIIPTSVIHDPKQAFVWMESAAVDGDAEAQYLLADMYLQGKGIDKSEMEALTWYGKAADQNSAYAQYSLGVMYYNGQGTEQNLLEANKWLELAALQGHSEAQYLLGRMYEQGFGVEQNPAKAYAWWQQIPKNNIVVDNFDEKLGTLISGMLPSERAEAERLTTEYKAKVKA